MLILTHPPAGTATVEIEIKLALDARAARRLRHLPLLLPHAPVRRRLYTVYYDTPDFALLRAGVALRLRREGYHWVQTVKARAGSGGMLAQRPEWEVHLAGKQPDPEVLPEAARAALPDIAPKRFAPVFETAFQRTAWLIGTGEGAVELALDQGEIRAGGKTLPLREVELELKSGTLADLFTLAERLLAELAEAPAGKPSRTRRVAPSVAASAGIWLEPRSKAQRGYQLAGALPLVPVKAVLPAIDLEGAAGEAYCAIARACLTQFEANLPGYLADSGSANPEYVHQMRVALRRLRAATGLLRFMGIETPAWVGELKWLMRALAQARDWDVFVTETLPRVAAGLSRPQALEPLCAAAQRLRDAAHAHAAAALQGKRLVHLWLTLERALAEFPATPVATRQWAQAALDRRYRQLRRLGNRLDALDAAERHALRIAGKKLRYAAEFFAPLKPKPAHRFIAALARLQDVLGVLNDVAVTTRLLEEAKQIGGAAVWEAAGLVAGFTAHEQADRLAELAKAWRAFRAVKPYWR